MRRARTSGTATRLFYAKSIDARPRGGRHRRPKDPHALHPSAGDDRRPASVVQRSTSVTTTSTGGWRHGDSGELRPSSARRRSELIGIFSEFLAHSNWANAIARRPSSVCLSVCLSVCKLLHENRYFYHKHDWIATKLTHDGPHMGLHPGCAQGQGQGQRSRDTGTSVMSRNVCYTVYLLTFCLYMHSLYEAPLHSPSSTSVRQLDVMSTQWNELLRHWRSCLLYIILRDVPYIRLRFRPSCSQKPDIWTG